MSAQWSPCGCPMVLSASGAMVPRCEDVEAIVPPGNCAKRKVGGRGARKSKPKGITYSQKRNTNVTPAPDAETSGAGLSDAGGDNVS